MTSQMKTFSALLAICEGNPRWFPSQRPVTCSFEVFFDLCLNKRLSIQLRRRLFETSSRSSWALMFSLMCAWINSWVNNRGAGDLRRHRVHYDVTVMDWLIFANLHKMTDNRLKLYIMLSFGFFSVDTCTDWNKDMKLWKSIKSLTA